MEEKEANNDLIRSSFFDDLKDTLPFRYDLWLNHEEFRRVIEKFCHLSGDLIFEGQLINKCKKKEDVSTKYYKLYKDRLECYKVILPLSRQKIVKFPKNS